MTENLWVAAQISLLGMSLVFGAILLLWGVLALLVRLTTERLPHEAVPMIDEAPAAPTPSLSANRKTAMARAAAAGVAIALALKPQPSATGEPGSNTPNSTVSAWQAVMRATRLNAHRPRR